MPNAIYYVEYKLKKGASVSDFLQASEKLNDGHISKQQGYISWKQFHDGKSDIWTDFCTFETMDDLEAFKASSANPCELAQHFYSYINLPSCRVRFYSVERTYGDVKWGCEMTPYEKAEQLHKKVNTFILSCVGSDGYPLTKAVVPSKHRESLSELYFCTNTSSKFAAEINKNPKTGVYFYSRKLVIWKGCYLKGDMEIVTDIALKEKLWDNKYKGAYEQGTFTDPDFCVLRFTPKTGRLYANFTIEDFEF